MAETSLLEKVKSMLGVTGTYQDQTLQFHIDEVKQYLLDGGVSQETVEAPTSAGIIARGVCDLWNYGAGDGRLSTYFIERAIQLSYRQTEGEKHMLHHVTNQEINDMMGVKTPPQDDKHEIYHVTEQEIDEMMGVSKQ